MKSLLVFACALSLFVFQASAFGRDAESILKEYKSIEIPKLEASKRNDSTAVRRYYQDKAAALDQQNALADELYRSHPEHPQAVSLMASRLTNLMSGKSSAQATKEIEAFVKAHPQADQSPDLLSLVARRTTDKAQQLSTYRRIVANYPSSQAAKSAAGSIRQIEAIGKPFDLSFTDAITHKPVSIKSLRGKVVVIDFWATWCGPCVAEMSKMKDLYARYKSQGVEFIGVSLDGPGEGLEKLKKFVDDNTITWPQYHQGKSWQSEFSQSWGISAIPTVFIIDAVGNLHSTDARGHLDNLLPDLLAKRDGSSPSKQRLNHTSATRQPTL